MPINMFGVGPMAPGMTIHPQNKMMPGISNFPMMNPSFMPPQVRGGPDINQMNPAIPQLNSPQQTDFRAKIEKFSNEKAYFLQNIKDDPDYEKVFK
jgi:hypothetical protein